MPSLKKNIVYSSLLTVAGYVFPLMTFPYVTRVLGVENLGICNFVNSAIEYFCVFSLLGVNTIGIREIAKVKGDKDKVSRVFSSILCLNLITTIISIFVLFLLINVVPKFNEYREMMYIGAGKILFNSLLIEWLYKGFEDFEYITKRSIFVRCLFVISIFLLVRTPDDYKLYFLLTVMGFVVNASINLVYSRHYVRFSFKNLLFKPYIVPLVTLGAHRILTSMYISFNVTFLGISSGEIEVGYYTTAIKLYAVIISLFSAFTGVMLPRMSSILASDNVSEFKRLTNKSIDALLAFSIPLIVITEMYAPQIIRVIAGEGYEGAIFPMRLIMPLMLLIGYEQIIISQMLVPMKKDRAILINSFAGASVALILNFIIVPLMASVGSAIVWIASEFAVAISAQYFINKYIGYKVPIKKISYRIISTIPIIVICYMMTLCISNSYVLMILGSVLVIFYYLVYESIIMKNELVVSNMKVIKNKCERLFH